MEKFLSILIFWPYLFFSYTFIIMIKKRKKKKNSKDKKISKKVTKEIGGPKGLESQLDMVIGK